MYMDEPKRLYIPLILGTPRQGRKSEHVAKFLLSEMQKRPEIETELIDVRELKMTLQDAGSEMADPDYVKKIERADGLAIVVPEYNHGYPGALKQALDMCLEEYIHKPVALCGVSAGPFGGARVIENLVPVMRELGLAVTFTDVNFSSVGNAFDETGNLKEEKYVGRVAKFLNELVWMTRVLRYGRQNFRPYPAELYFGFNVKNPKFADPRFREAIVRGIDREAIVTAVYKGTVRPANSIALADVGYPVAGCERCRHDPDRARALLQEAFKGAPPPPVALDFDDDDTQAAIANTIQASLRDVGIRVDLRPKAPRDYDSFALSDQPELFRLVWVARYPSADAILAPLFATESLDNLTGYSNPAVDAMLKSARLESDPGRRVELYQQIESTIMEQLPVVPIAQFNVHSVIAKRAKGVKLNSFGSFDATQVRVG